MRAYLIARQGQMRGEFWALQEGQPLTVGRSSENRIVLKDDLCSRQHAEFYSANDRWTVRDLGSRNGTHVNGGPITEPTPLALDDVIRIGKTEFVLTGKLEAFGLRAGRDVAEPGEPDSTGVEPGLTITARQRSSRFLTESESQLLEQPQVAQALSRLYRIGLAMGAARDLKGLAESVLDGILDATCADTGAVLMAGPGRELSLTAYRGKEIYHKVSEYISGLVMRENEGILAHDIRSDGSLKNRQSLEDIGAESLICAPLRSEDQVAGLVHLYSTDPTRALGRDDLEFTLAVLQQFSQALDDLNERDQLKGENQRLRENLRIETELVGQSLGIHQVKQQIARVAATNATVLVRGESGVGKELVARAIHINSARSAGPLVCLNCAALTETLLESELFGHEKGSFTGATEQKIGKFEAAYRGTIFLDEIGEMNPSTQAKLLRVLEGQPFERVGGSEPIQVDVRVVAATNVDLETAVQQGSFRRDLYFRLQVVELVIPPLRERKEDIPLLANFFLNHLSEGRMTGFTDGALRKLMSYDWPGNARELRNVVERAVVFAPGTKVTEGEILLSSISLPASESSKYRAVSLEEREREHVAATLAHTAWNKSRAAAILGIERSTLDRKIHRYGLTSD